MTLGYKITSLEFGVNKTMKYTCSKTVRPNMTIVQSLKTQYNQQESRMKHYHKESLQLYECIPR